MSSEPDIYGYWRAALAGRPEAELQALRLPTIGAAIPGENPQPGLWKVRAVKGGPQVLLQIWLADAEGKAVNQWGAGLEIAGTIAGHPATADALVQRWLYVEPASREDAAYWREHGRWPGDAPPLPPRNHNQPADPYAMLLGEANERVEQARARLEQPIADQVACDMARNLQAELLALLKRADEAHEKEKRPHLDACRDVDRRYDFRATLSGWARKLREAFGAWMASEERRRQEEQLAAYRAEQARVEAERQRIEAERAQKLADDPVAALTEPEPELPPPPPAPEPVKMQSGGGTGRKAGLKTEWDIEITDIKAAAAFLSNQSDVAIAVGKAAKRVAKAAKGQIGIPGVKIIERRVAA